MVGIPRDGKYPILRDGMCRCRNICSDERHSRNSELISELSDQILKIGRGIPVSNSIGNNLFNLNNCFSYKCAPGYLKLILKQGAVPAYYKGEKGLDFKGDFS